MSSEKIRLVLGAVLGLGYIGLGIAESISHVDDYTIFLWFLMLCGGGVLILIGVFRIVSTASASMALVTVGALAGALMSAWTVLTPILSIALIGLTVLRTRRAPTSTA